MYGEVTISAPGTAKLGGGLVEAVSCIFSMVASDSKVFADEGQLDKAGKDKFAMAESRLTPDMMLKHKKV